MDRSFVVWSTEYFLLHSLQVQEEKNGTYQIYHHALIERLLDIATLPEILVVILQAFPVLSEFPVAYGLHFSDPKCLNNTTEWRLQVLHTSRHFPALQRTMVRISILSLAKHEIIVVIFAMRIYII